MLLFSPVDTSPGGTSPRLKAGVQPGNGRDTNPPDVAVPGLGKKCSRGLLPGCCRAAGP